MKPEETEQRDDAAGRAGIENLTLWQRVHEHLRQEILDNRLPPGSELNEVALSQALGVSRGPVREALGRLASEGLVTSARGAAPSSPRSRRRSSSLPTSCERRSRRSRSGSRCRGSAPTGSPGCRRSSTRWSCSRTGTDVDAFFRANAAFHATFVEASGNPMLQETMSRLIGQMGRYRMRSVALRGSLRRSTGEHKAILQRRARGRRREGGAAARRAHPHPAASPRGCARRGGRHPQCQLTRGPSSFGVNLNNREPLIAPDYDLKMLLDLSTVVEESRLRLGLGRRQPLLEAALGADLAPLGDLAAHLARQARHRVHGLVDAQPALSRARVGDARRDLGRAHDSRHRNGQPRRGRSPRVRGARARLQEAGRDLRRGPRGDPAALDEGERHASTASTSPTTTCPSSPAPSSGR